MIPKRFYEEHSNLVTKSFKKGLTKQESNRLMTIRKLMDMSDYVDGYWDFSDTHRVVVYENQSFHLYGGS